MVAVKTKIIKQSIILIFLGLVAFQFFDRQAEYLYVQIAFVLAIIALALYYFIQKRKESH